MAGVRSVVPSDFSEDEFQALAFAHLAVALQGMVVGGPFILDRRVERRIGIDAWVRIRHGGRLKVLAFQFKVPDMIIRAGLDPQCAAIYSDDPYFRFRLHQDKKLKKAGSSLVHLQHNNLVALRRAGVMAVYCAPAILLHTQLFNEFFRMNLFDRCLLGDPAQIGPLGDANGHHVTYSLDARSWGFHSEARKLPNPLAWSELFDHTEAQDFDVDTLDDLSDRIADALDLLEMKPPKNELPPGPNAVIRLHRIASSINASLALIPEPKDRSTSS